MERFITERRAFCLPCAFAERVSSMLGLVFYRRPALQLDPKHEALLAHEQLERQLMKRDGIQRAMFWCPSAWKSSR